MRIDGHKKKIASFENTINELSYSAESVHRNGPTIISNLFTIGCHWIAIGLDRRHREHPDSHKVMHRWLKDRGYEQSANDFEALKGLRSGADYGSKEDGESVEKARRIVGILREWAEAEL